MGNLPGVICLDHSCHEKRGLARVDEEVCLERKEDNHAWKVCQFCTSKLLADSASWGSLCLCVDCWNLYVEAERFPPTTTLLVVEEVRAGTLEIGWDRHTETSIRVRK